MNIPYLIFMCMILLLLYISIGIRQKYDGQIYLFNDASCAGWDNAFYPSFSVYGGQKNRQSYLALFSWTQNQSQ